MEKNITPLTSRDLFYGGINGAIFGAMAIFILHNSDALIFHPALLFLFFVILAVIGIAIGYFLSRFVASFFFQLAKFGAVGAANFSVDLGVLSLLTYIFSVYTGNLVGLFKIISFIAAVTNSYFWNKFWSFGDKSSSDIKEEYSKFLLVSVIGAGVNVGTFWILINILGPQAGIATATWTTVSAAISAIAVLVWNFLGYKFVVFKSVK